MDEADIIRKSMLGDAPALELLIDKYYRAIYAFCCRRVGDVSVGEELCQDTFMKMVENLPRYREQGSFKSWLFTIAANCCRDSLRKKKPVYELNDNIVDLKVNFRQETENSLLLKKALEALPEIQKEAIVLRYYHDFSAVEIARVQKASVPTTKTRLHRALRKLKSILGEEILLET